MEWLSRVVVRRTTKTVSSEPHNRTTNKNPRNKNYVSNDCWGKKETIKKSTVVQVELYLYLYSYEYEYEYKYNLHFYFLQKIECFLQLGVRLVLPIPLPLPHSQPPLPL